MVLLRRAGPINIAGKKYSRQWLDRRIADSRDPNKNLDRDLYASRVKQSVKLEVRHRLETISRLKTQTRLEEGLKLLKRGPLANFKPLLPLLLSIKGEPYHLGDHYTFEPFFSTLMPRRLVYKTGRQVAKSTSMAAQGIIQSNTISFFNTLYVTPRYETVRRFSSNYVRGFIEQSPVRSLLVDSSCTNSVLQRSFRNNSAMFFSFAYLDCDRTRGLNTDKTCYDESVKCGAMIETPFGDKKIEDFRPGDKILSFDEAGCVQEDEVVASSDHGIRDCYKFTFASGEEVEATSESWVATTDGWKRIATIIDDLAGGINRGAAADAAGNDAGGCKHGDAENQQRQSTVPQSARPVSARLQLPKVPGITQVRKHAAVQEEEQRLGRLVERISNQELSGLLAYRILVHPQRPEASDASMAGRTDLGRCGLVADGRRDVERHAAAVQHAGILASGSTAACGLVDGARDCSLAASGDQPAQSSETIHAPEILREATLTAITCTGRHAVWDLATKRNNTFFAGGVAVHNCQDLLPEFIPIIRETMSGSRRGGYELFTGTPKTLEGTLENLWSDSSQAEWHIRCKACGKENIPTLAHDLDAMTGPSVVTREISEAMPGVVCAKCGRPIFPREGHWVHHFPQARLDFAGYHVPQLIMPTHFADSEKWAVLLGKRDGFGNTAEYMYYNEVCGESFDSGAKMITKTELMAACESRPNDLDHAASLAGNYLQRVVSIDWGGGGQDMVSFTVVSVLGIRADGRIDVLYAHRFRSMHAYAQEAHAILYIMGKCRCSYVVHDFGGRGDIREHLLINAGLSREQIIPMAYIGPAVGEIVHYKPENVETGQRMYYQCDKARSLVLTCELIRYRRLRFFEYDHKGAGHAGLLHDFLALIEDTVESPTRSHLMKIIRDEKVGPDDFAHSVNIGCMALFHLRGEYPDLAMAAKIAVDPRIIEQLHPIQPNWDMF